MTSWGNYLPLILQLVPFKFPHTPAPDSDEERALEEELVNEARRTQLGNDDCYNPNMEGIS